MPSPSLSRPVAPPGSGGVVDADVVVVGAGVAGLVLALDLAELRPGTRIVVLDKGAAGEGGSTPLAQGGLAAAVGPGDSPRLHAEDTVRAGDGLCEHPAVAALATEAPARVADLIRRGVRFDRLDGGALHLAREGGQTVPRCVHAADATGAEIFRALRIAVSPPAGAPPLTRLRGTACALATATGPDGPRACGVWALLDEAEAAPLSPAQSAGMVLLRAPAVVIATGGCGGLYAATTNRDSATGDGVALAYAAGAALLDCEFVQFHPTGLRTGEAGGSRPLLTEALRGGGAVLRDAAGRAFMGDYHPDADLAPRHVVAKAILDQPGGAWLDATSLGPERLAAEFPTALSGTRAHGFDLAGEPVPVEPTQHYLVGGIATDLHGATTLPGLFAVGEAACTGVHGANRMAGNSLAEACVFAHRAARALAAVDGPRLDPDGEAPGFEQHPPVDLVGARAELRAAMSAGAGPVRSAASLDAAGKSLEALGSVLGPRPAASRVAIEVAHSYRLARLVVRSARLRSESRGVHYREDAPERERAWDGVRLRVAVDGAEPAFHGLIASSRP